MESNYKYPCSWSIGSESRSNSDITWLFPEQEPCSLEGLLALSWAAQFGALFAFATRKTADSFCRELRLTGANVHSHRGLCVISGKSARVVFFGWTGENDEQPLWGIAGCLHESAAIKADDDEPVMHTQRLPLLAPPPSSTLSNRASLHF